MAVGLAGVEAALDRTGALWLPAERALVVSDLHFEKGSAYAARGALLPPYDTRATLEALAGVIAAYAPLTVVALGDSFHDAGLETRMAARDLDALKSMVRGVGAWVWIEGNHDPEPPAHLGGTVMETLTLGRLSLRHEPSSAPAPGEIAGHLHPCARIARRGRSVRRRCFASDGERLIAPAFGAYAGGLSVREPAIWELFAAPPLVFLLGRDRVWPALGRHTRPD